MRKHTWGLLGAGLTLALLTAACGGRAPAPKGPAAADSVQAWIEAVRRDDPRAAYALLSPAQQKQVPYDDFEQKWAASKPELQRQARALEGGLAGAQLGERAVVQLPDGEQATLVHEGAEWHLETPLVSSRRATTPQEALRLLASAVEARDFAAVMQILTSTRREGLDEVLTRFTTGLRNNIGGEIVITGDRATIPWDDGKNKWKITLKLEDGEWRIDDIHRD